MRWGGRVEDRSGEVGGDGVGTVGDSGGDHESCDRLLRVRVRVDDYLDRSQKCVRQPRKEKMKLLHHTFTSHLIKESKVSRIQKTAGEDTEKFTSRPCISSPLLYPLP